MRSLQDHHFSELCDRVKTGSITEDDKKFLMSRVLPCDLEHSNENFKSGKLIIVVTTNLKKNLVNQQKLAELLPNQQQYSCNSKDWVTNLPVGNKISDRLNRNPGKTGNLQIQLNL